MLPETIHYSHVVPVSLSEDHKNEVYVHVSEPDGKKLAIAINAGGHLGFHIAY